MEYEVTKCENCPFLIWSPQYEEHECTHPERENIINSFVSQIKLFPDWCPLNEGSTIITKKA